ncbi:hypothetical protein V6Z11_A12G025300 [Gossypium hirsutum]
MLSLSLMLLCQVIRQTTHPAVHKISSSIFKFCMVHAHLNPYYRILMTIKR